MSLESGRKSDIYDRILAEDQKDPIFARQSFGVPSQHTSEVATFNQRLSE
jgi:hypothetical protein